MSRDGLIAAILADIRADTLNAIGRGPTPEDIDAYMAALAADVKAHFADPFGEDNANDDRREGR